MVDRFPTCFVCGRQNRNESYRTIGWNDRYEIPWNRQDSKASNHIVLICVIVPYGNGCCAVLFCVFFAPVETQYGEGR